MYPERQLIDIGNGSMIKGVHMFSGGLDSVVSAHLLKSLQVDLTLIHFVLPFYSGLGSDEYHAIKVSAEQLGLPLRIVEDGEEFLMMIKDPKFGFGKNANPCIDCRIYRLGITKKIMTEMGASFISTGEVMGQRPMSQRRDMLFRIENEARCKGILLRPLSAQHLSPTVPEQQGLIDRSKLLDIAGRGRGQQIAYAKQFNLSYPAPGGGCILTSVQSGHRYLDLAQHHPDYTMTDFKLIAFGRHFRLSDTARLIVSRDERENQVLLRIVGEHDCYLYPTDVPGPVGILRGKFTEADLLAAASITARYSKGRDHEQVKVAIVEGEARQYHPVKPAVDTYCEGIRIAQNQNRCNYSQ
jgi:tRNA U34 2-thiouridine synthase MnmA/TrmU